MGGIYGEICTKKGIYQRKWRLCGIILHGVLPLPQYMLPYGDYEFTFILTPVKHSVEIE